MEAPDPELASPIPIALSTWAEKCLDLYVLTKLQNNLDAANNDPGAKAYRAIKIASENPDDGAFIVLIFNPTAQRITVNLAIAGSTDPVPSENEPQDGSINWSYLNAEETNLLKWLQNHSSGLRPITITVPPRDVFVERALPPPLANSDTDRYYAQAVFRGAQASEFLFDRTNILAWGVYQPQ